MNMQKIFIPESDFDIDDVVRISTNSLMGDSEEIIGTVIQKILTISEYACSINYEYAYDVSADGTVYEGIPQERVKYCYEIKYES